MTWSIDGVSGQEQREQGRHHRDADRKHPLPGCRAYSFGRARRIRKHHGAHRTRDQRLAADEGDQPVRRLRQERGEEEPEGDARAPQREQPRKPRTPRPQEGEEQREDKVELLLHAQRPEVDAVHLHRIPRNVDKFRLDPCVEEDPPVHDVENIDGQVGNADRGRRHSQYEVVGGKDSQRAARVEALEHPRARPALECDQDPGDEKSADHEEQGDAMAARPEARDIAVHQEHGQKREEPQSVDLFAMLERWHWA